MLRTSPSHSGTAATMTIQVAPVGEGSLACPNGYRDATLALREAKAASQSGWMVVQQFVVQELLESGELGLYKSGRYHGMLYGPPLVSSMLEFKTVACNNVTSASKCWTLPALRLE